MYIHCRALYLHTHTNNKKRAESNQANARVQQQTGSEDQETSSKAALPTCITDTRREMHATHHTARPQ